MRPEMKAEPGAEVNTPKTSIRSGGNPRSSLLRSASPHLGRAGDPRSRRSRPAAGSPGAVPRRCCGPAPPRWRPAEQGAGAGPGAGGAGGRCCAGRRSLPMHCAWQPGERPRRPASPPPPGAAPAAPIGCGRPDVTQPLNFPSGGRAKVWGRAGPAAPRSPLAARRRGSGDAVPAAGESPPPSPGSGFGKECAGGRPGPTARRGVIGLGFPLRGKLAAFCSRFRTPRVPPGGQRPPGRLRSPSRAEPRRGGTSRRRAAPPAVPPGCRCLSLQDRWRG